MYTHGASLDGSKGVYIIRGHRTGFGKKDGRWVAATQKFPLCRNEMAAITFEPYRLHLGERSLWCWRTNGHANDEQRAIQAS